MKKRLLFVLPALLLMSSCAALRNAENLNLKANDNIEYYQEDTLAHEELFGELEALDMKAPLRLGDPNDEPGNDPTWTKMPKVGVQFCDEYGKAFAIRFVAAIANDDMTVTWNRAVSDKDGNQLKAFDTGHQSLVRYNSLKNGDKTSSASDEGTGYSKYVVYTMYDIPNDQGESYIAAYLTLSTQGEEDVVSKVVAAQINGKFSYSFDMSELSNEGTFLAGIPENAKNRLFIPSIPGDYADSFTFDATDTIDLLTDSNVGLFRFKRNDGFWFYSSAFILYLDYETSGGMHAGLAQSAVIDNFVSISDPSGLPIYNQNFVVFDDNVYGTGGYILIII